MEIAVVEAQGRVPVTILRLRGPITTNVELEQAAQAAYDAGARNLLIDLTNVPYIATYGLRALHFIYGLLRADDTELGAPAARSAAGGPTLSPHLRLLRPSAHALEALKVAGYDLFIEIHTDDERALAAF